MSLDFCTVFMLCTLSPRQIPYMGKPFLIRIKEEHNIYIIYNVELKPLTDCGSFLLDKDCC